MSLARIVAGSARFGKSAVKGAGKIIGGATKGVATKSGALDLGIKVGLGAMTANIGLNVINSKLEGPVNARRQKLDQIQKFSSQLDKTYR